MAVGFQLNDVIASTAIKEYDILHQITDLREYVEYDYWASEASPTLGCSIEISRDIYYIVSVVGHNA